MLMLGCMYSLVDSGIYAASTAHQMLAGTYFTLALRGLLLVCEVLTTCLLAAFVVWCEKSRGHT